MRGLAVRRYAAEPAYTNWAPIGRLRRLLAPRFFPAAHPESRLARCRATSPTVRGARLAYRPQPSLADSRHRRSRLGIDAQSVWGRRGRGGYLCALTWSAKDGARSRIYNSHPPSYFLDPARVSVADSQTKQEDAPLSVVCRVCIPENNLHTYLSYGRLYFAPKCAKCRFANAYFPQLSATSAFFLWGGWG